MNLKERIFSYQQEAKILESVASHYAEDSKEYATIRHAAIALWYVLTEDYERFRDYAKNWAEAADLTPEQRAHLIAMGIDPDADPEDCDNTLS